MEIQQLEPGKFTQNLNQTKDELIEVTQTVQLNGGRGYLAVFTDLAEVIREEKELSKSYNHDLTVQKTLVQVWELD